MKTIPVAVFVYKRPGHTAKMLDALSRNRLASQTDLIIFSDGPKTEADIAPVQKVRDLLRDTSGFKSVELVVSDKNKGLANSIINGVTEVLRAHEAVIVLEDDLISSSDFLSYMNAALEFYRDKEKVFSVAGFAPNIKIASDYQFDSYLIPTRGCSWGWGTWKRVWEQVDWEVSDYEQFMSDKTRQKKFIALGKDMERMLRRQMEGQLDSWSIRFDYHHGKYDGYAAYPVTSKILNEGMDGSGENSAQTGFFSSALEVEDKASYNFSVLPDEQIIKASRKYYNRSLNLWNKFLITLHKKRLLP